jgi:hypothetical protein
MKRRKLSFALLLLLHRLFPSQDEVEADQMLLSQEILHPFHHYFHVQR